jgi:hypothetical protein
MNWVTTVTGHSRVFDHLWLSGCPDKQSLPIAHCQLPSCYR